MKHIEYSSLREAMVREQLIPRGIRDQRVLDAMHTVPRHRFVPESLQDQAYRDSPLPIGEGQTISQPYIVAAMTEALELHPEDRVLEIGTGTAYQTAILAELAREVFSIESLDILLQRAREILSDLGYTNITTRCGDGTLGWPEHSPYDAIMVTAGAPQVPPPLVQQLAVRGRLLLPVGDAVSQTLTKITKTPNGLAEEILGGCRFVKLVGAQGWQA